MWQVQVGNKINNKFKLNRLRSSVTVLKMLALLVYSIDMWSINLHIYNIA